MQIFKKAVVILCAAALTAGACAFCGCGGKNSDEPRKPSVPDGVVKVANENLAETAQEYGERLNNSKNYTIDVYNYSEYRHLSPPSDGVEPGIGGTLNPYNRQLKLEGVGYLKVFTENNNDLRDCKFEKMYEEYVALGNNPENPEETEEVLKYNVTGETALKDGVVFTKYTDGEKTQKGKTEPMAGLDYFFKSSQYYDNQTSFNRQLDRTEIMNNWCNSAVLNNYLLYINNDEDYIPFGGEDSGNIYPRDAVKVYEVDLRAGENALYFSYKYELKYETQTDNGYLFHYFKMENIFAVNLSAGLDASDFDDVQINEKDIENVIYVNPQNGVFEQIAAGESAELIPVGGGDLDKLSVTVYAMTSSYPLPYNGVSVKADIKNGKITVPPLDLSYLEQYRKENDKLIIYVQASYGSSICSTNIYYVTDFKD